MRIEDLKQIVKDEIIQRREEGYVAEVEENLSRIESATLP